MEIKIRPRVKCFFASILAAQNRLQRLAGRSQSMNIPQMTSKFSISPRNHKKHAKKRKFPLPIIGNDPQAVREKN
jgi:hypothetical protein